MRICFVLHTSGMGGAERVSLELIEVLVKKGIQCFAILPSYGLIVEVLKKRNIPFKIISYKWWAREMGSPIWKRMGRLAINLIKTFYVMRQIRKWKVNIIYSNTITICVGAFAAKLLHLPHIWHIHEFGKEDFCLHFDFGEKIAMMMMKGLSDVCIVSSKAVMEKYEKYFPVLKMRLVYFAVPVVDESSYKVKKIKQRLQEMPGIKCVIVGSLYKGKRQEDAIRAIGKLVNEGIPAYLYIIGEGRLEYKQYLKDLVTRYGLENNIFFLGYIDNPFPIIVQSDVLLMCSRNEAFGRVTVEGMKAGKPVIGTNSGGTIELIKDYFNGFLYTFGDYQELAEKIKYFYQNSGEAKKMGQNGKKWALEKFNIGKFTEEILTILRKLID